MIRPTLLIITFLFCSTLEAQAKWSVELANTILAKGRLVLSIPEEGRWYFEYKNRIYVCGMLDDLYITCTLHEKP